MHRRWCTFVFHPLSLEHQFDPIRSQSNGIFIGPRCPWGPIYGQGRVYSTIFYSESIEMSCSHDEQGWGHITNGNLGPKAKFRRFVGKIVWNPTKTSRENKFENVETGLKGIQKVGIREIFHPNIARGTTDPGYWVYNLIMFLTKIYLKSFWLKKIIQVTNSIPWVRCASGNVFTTHQTQQPDFLSKPILAIHDFESWSLLD